LKRWGDRVIGRWGERGIRMSGDQVVKGKIDKKIRRWREPCNRYLQA
jgi:hypothetical protein